MAAHKLNRRRGQVSLEYAVVVGLVLAACVPAWLLAQQRISDAQTQLDAATAQSAVDAVVKAADWAVLSGYPARRTVEIDLPKSVQSAQVGGREVRILFYGSAGPTEAYGVSHANLSGDIPVGGARVRLLVAASQAQQGNVTVSKVG
jgi:uncharacterized protein (UPF0333 family)